jgi:CRP-like cAMP-binding protein
MSKKQIIMSLHAKRLTALKHAICSLSDIPDKEWEYFSRQTGECGYNLNDLLVRAGEPMRDFFFIISGLVRYYYSTENGKEFNKAFTLENNFVGSFGADVAQEPCRFSIQALEQTEALVIPVQVIREGYDRHHCWERVGRKIAERVAVSKELREGEFLLDSAETRYRRFLATYPGLAERINQYHIASYLGITDVALSRIRKNIGMIDIFKTN